MAKIYKSAEELIGNTPLLELTKIEKEFSLKAHIFAKIESLNPTGSAKDRAALWMINEAEKRGELHPGATIIEPTSGNTGIGLAQVAVGRGYKVIIVMPDTMSEERRKLMKAYGASLELTPGAEGMAGSIRKAEELKSKIPGSFIPNQFENKDNAKAHFETTGPEIWADTDGDIDAFVAGIGTGGTITGTGEFLKSKNSDIKIVGVEPAASPLITKGVAASHGIQGIGANFIPGVLNRDIVDEILAITDEDSYEMAALICRKEGIMVGISSGAALKGALILAERKEYEGKNIVVLLPDSGDRYLSTDLF